MIISKELKKRGFTLEQYEQFEENIEATGNAIIQNIKHLGIEGNGMYYDINIILTEATEEIMFYAIIQNLKTKGVEFINNNKEFRY